MQRLAFLFAILLTSSTAMAQLNPGDIAITGYQSDNPDVVTFVALVDIPAAEPIRFTENGWLAAGGFRTGEGVIEWTSTAILTAGTVVELDPAGLVASVGALTNVTGSWALSTSGDQVIVFQGDVSTPTPIAAFHMGSWGDATNTNTSALPTGLTDGFDAVAITSNPDNAIYDCSNVNDDVGGLLASINDENNWTTSNSVMFPATPCTFTLVTADVCNDGVQTGSEVCDTNDTPASDCTAYGYVDPAGLACNTTCDDYITTGCTAVCNNGTSEPTETCDGTDVGSEDCTTQGFDNPAGLACSTTCDGYDISGCTPVCDGNTVEPGEDCDDGPADTASCDFDCTTPTCGDGHCNTVAGETISGCAADCAPVCGDNTAAGGEVCDGTDLAGTDCTDYGYVDPTGLVCNGSCDDFITTGCTAVCTNDVAEPGETCDGSDVGMTDCTDYGYTNGTGLVCNTSCDDYDTSGCNPTCDGTLLEPGEECDGTLLGSADCTTLGYVDGTGLACSSCTFDDSGCTAVCGNGTVEPGEDCDDSGETATCDDDCTPAACGDGNCNAAASEDLSTCILDCAPPGTFRIAIIAYNADTPDQFTFVALSDLPTGLRIRFTDNGWLAAGGFRQNEGIVEWEVTADVTAGTEVTVTPGASASHGTITGINGSIALSASGDQLLAYLGDETSPEFLDGLQMNGPWDADATSANESALPTGLVDGVSAMALDPEVDNAAYGCGITDGNAESLGILIHDPTNWVTDDTTPITQPPTCSFTVQAGDVCGDTVQTGTEVCDDPDVVGEDCTTQGFDEGTLTCAVSCDAFDVTACAYTCGNDSADGAEVCDGTDVGSETCESQGFDEGTLGCAGSCDAYDTAACAYTCGNDSADGTEVCDGTDVGSETCITQGFDTGNLGCAGSCDAYDTAACTVVCGNDSADGSEVCDGTDLAGADCTDEGYSTAAGLACAGTCDAYVTTGCTSTCGDTVVEPGEDCDSGGVDAASCNFDCTAAACDDGYCNPVAGEDPDACPADCPDVCGDALVTGAETCDDGDTDDGDGCSSVCAEEIGWACDEAEPSVCSEDPDADGVGNATDNCPNVGNPDQADGDGDGIGDACEYVAPPGGPDPDGEGCGCTSTPGGIALLGFVPFLLRRRRRR